jgi:hypothetical protein
VKQIGRWGAGDARMELLQGWFRWRIRWYPNVTVLGYIDYTYWSRERLAQHLNRKLAELGLPPHEFEGDDE